jgi:hypothetical protein
MAYVLKEKLKGLKEYIKVWNRMTYGQVDSKIAKLVVDINDLDIRSEGAGLLAEDVELRKNLFAQMWHLKISKASVLAQIKVSVKMVKGGGRKFSLFSCLH